MDEKEPNKFGEAIVEVKDNIRGVLTQPVDKYLTISEFRREIGLPFTVVSKMVSWGMIEAFVAVDGSLRISGNEVEKIRQFMHNPWNRTKVFIRALGPGLITGASDDDPSGIATYSTVGAQFGLALLWMSAWLLPMMAAIQETCARIGIITNKGLAGVLQKHYKKSIVIGAVFLLIIANIVNISADIGAMAASIRLFGNINFNLLAILIALLVIFMEIFIPYDKYVKVLKWLTIVLFGYIITGFIIHPDWIMILKNAVIPHFQFSKLFIFGIIAFFGTTITPYLFFWQTSEEVEEKEISTENGVMTPLKIKGRISRRRMDIKTGMFYSQLVAFFIVLTTASVLFKNGITDIASADQAAAALKPLAGNYAFILFALGIVGTGLLAIPILAGSCAYALSEVMNWKEGLSKTFRAARSFYLTIAMAVLLGLALNFVGVNPIKALYYAAYLNGLIAVPLMIVIMIVGNDKKIVGEETHPSWVKFFGWMAVIFMAVAVAVSIVLAII